MLAKQTHVSSKGRQANSRRFIVRVGVEHALEHPSGQVSNAPHQGSNPLCNHKQVAIYYQIVVQFLFYLFVMNKLLIEKI